MSALRLGLVGDGIAHSLSPMLHRAGLSSLQRAGTYVLYETQTEAQLAAGITRLRRGELDGLNVTTPWKEAAARQCERHFSCDETGVLAPIALGSMTAVNTLFVRDGLLCGTSTDGPGLGLALARCGVDVLRGPIGILGAGGAAASVADWLLGQGADVQWLSNRTEARAARLADRLGRAHHCGPPRVVSWRGDGAMPASLVIHASRTGHGCQGAAMRKAAVGLSQFPWDAWATSACVVDLVYGLTTTAAEHCALLAGASSASALSPTSLPPQPLQASVHVLTQTGPAMLAAQAALSLGIWAGMASPVAEMTAAIYQLYITEA
ncbi:MAG: hypothetical protein KC502_05900 [Myxococcales bacterium]|nr:hypothetical protein [Myxococcales bacterium]